MAKIQLHVSLRSLNTLMSEKKVVVAKQNEKLLFFKICCSGTTKYTVSKNVHSWNVRERKKNLRPKHSFDARGLFSYKNKKVVKRGKLLFGSLSISIVVKWTL